MVPALIFRLYLVVIGIVVFVLALNSLSKRKLMDNFTVIWCVLGFLSVLAGILVRATEMMRFMSVATLVLILTGVTLFIVACFVLSLCFSDLSRKNHELSMQVSLLNQENERIIHEIEVLRVGKGN